MDKLQSIINKFDKLLEDTDYIFEYASETMNEEFNEDVEKDKQKFYDILLELKNIK